MTSAFEIAGEFLFLANKEGKSLTSMQLVKIAYIAHGWSLATLGKPLFADRIEAWRYGPVIPSLYHETKQFGHEPVPLPRKGWPPLPEDVRELVKDVYKKYGHLTGRELSNMTNHKGTPYRVVHRPGVEELEIPNFVILGYYLTKLRELQGKEGKSNEE